MSDIIHLLPDHIANQIAAGEVIQRPASVVKELVENALDAGATTIQVNIKDAGKTLVQVIDDGKGMSETDARMAFERHATSKISTADDLFSLHTMGFRGEALASIAAVAHVELRTCQQGSEVGTRLSLAGSVVEEVEPDACAPGSIFSVKNLFYNVPARRKFLKSNETEFRNIIYEFERVALVNPELNLSLFHNEVQILNLPKSGLRQRILNVYGKNLNQKLLPIEATSSLVSINGFVGRPDSVKKRGALQYFFVNGRFMKHPYFHKAVMQAYDQLIPPGEQPNYFIYFQVDPVTIDVNIHPTKTEIKFENEQAIWQILSAAVKESIGMFNDVPTIDFDTEDKPEIPMFNPEEIPSASAPKISVNPGYNPFKTRSTTMAKPVGAGFPGPSSTKPEIDQNWKQLYEGLKDQDEQQHTMELFDEPEQATAAGTTANSIIAEKSPSHYQYKGKYIMTAVKSGLMIIDQHRAHVRILFEQYLKQLAERTFHSQKVLFPEVVQFPMSEKVIFEKILPEMNGMGFELEDLGGGSYAVNSVPAGLEGMNPVRLVQDMVSSAVEKGVSAMDEISQALALSLARQAAIPHGQVLSNEEMEGLVNGLFACENVNYTPDGKSVLCILQQQEIEHLLG